MTEAGKKSLGGWNWNSDLAQSRRALGRPLDRPPIIARFYGRIWNSAAVFSNPPPTGVLTNKVRPA